MFEKSLSDKLKRIFDLAKVSYNDPGDSLEQDVLFIKVDKAKNSIKDGRAYSVVTGSAVVYANSDKFPFAYFSKRIKLADRADTKDLFFFDIESNARIYLNIVQRGFSFVYFFNGQYDPEIGTITSITTEVET